MGLVRRRGHARDLQHRARRGTALPWVPTTAYERRVRTCGLGRERPPVRRISSTRLLGYPSDAGRHARCRVSDEAVPQRLDRHHSAQRADRIHHSGRTRPGALTRRDPPQRCRSAATRAALLRPTCITTAAPGARAQLSDQFSAAGWATMTSRSEASSGVWRVTMPFRSTTRSTPGPGRAHRRAGPRWPPGPAAHDAARSGGPLDSRTIESTATDRRPSPVRVLSPDRADPYSSGYEGRPHAHA